jgi:hypothetical protein
VKSSVANSVAPLSFGIVDSKYFFDNRFFIPSLSRCLTLGMIVLCKGRGIRFARRSKEGANVYRLLALNS